MAKEKRVVGLPTIICGPHKDFDDYEMVKRAIKESGFEISEVISGKAKGVDSLGERWAKENQIPIKPFPAKWTDFSHPDSEVKFRKDWNGNETSYNPKAGPIRNEQMIVEGKPDYALLFLSSL